LGKQSSGNIIRKLQSLDRKAEYVDKPQQAIWEAVATAHSQVDSVLQIERELSKSFSEDLKYSFEERNGLTVRVYSREFTEAYNFALNGMVERQMRNSIKMIADFWYTGWINAGQTDLNTDDFTLTEEEEVLNPDPKLKVREHN